MRAVKRRKKSKKKKTVPENLHTVCVWRQSWASAACWANTRVCNGVSWWCTKGEATALQKTCLWKANTLWIRGSTHTFKGNNKKLKSHTHTRARVILQPAGKALSGNPRPRKELQETAVWICFHFTGYLHNSCHYPPESRIKVKAGKQQQRGGRSQSEARHQTPGDPALRSNYLKDHRNVFPSLPVIFRFWTLQFNF